MEEDSAYGELPIPTRDGYIFVGWYTTRYGGIEVTEDTLATANRTVYAHWEEEPDDPDFPDDPDEPDDPWDPFDPDNPNNPSGPDDYDYVAKLCVVTLNANGGRVHQNTKIAVPSCNYGELPTPFRMGYHFAGWYTQKVGGDRITEKTKVEHISSKTLYAHWTTDAVSIVKTETGNWTVYLPSYCGLLTYDNPTTAMPAGGLGGGYAVFDLPCTQRVTLSNGTVRYYGILGNSYVWFTYTCEMDVE